MFKYLPWLLFCICTQVVAQDSTSLNHELDSILSIKIKTTRKEFSSEYDSVRHGVFYAKKTSEIIAIREVHYPVEGGKTKWWIYRYQFRNGNLILITKHNNTDPKDPKRQNAYYYFRDNSLVYHQEMGTSIPDIDAEKRKAEYLKSKFSKIPPRSVWEKQ